MTQPTQLQSTITDDPRWTSVVARDAKADGTFYYSVKTTGVYCRPSCGARLARPENVQFHTSCAEAEQAGFRPCLRCRPNEASPSHQLSEKIAEMCRMLETSDQTPKLVDLAAHAGMSPYYFHRVFRYITGVTPRQYAAGHRTRQVRTSLRKTSTVTEAIYDAGYNSNGRFYATANDFLGMTPSTYRAGGTRTEIRFAIGECSLGAILVAQSERGICAILLGDDPETLTRQLQDHFPQANLIGGDAGYEELVATVIGLVEAPGLGTDLPLDVRGTAFQQRVWQALRKIPAGSTATYTDVAREIGAPGSVRAVAQACAANKLAIAIPCHRVVRLDGELSGYRWGVERKRSLLEREQRA